MKIDKLNAYHQQLTIQEIDQHIMELKHQELKIRAAITENERMRLRRLDTGGKSRGLGTKVDTLA